MKSLFIVTTAVLLLICGVSEVEATEAVAPIAEAPEMEEKSFDERLEERIEKLVESSMESALKYTEDLQNKIHEKQQTKAKKDREIKRLLGISSSLGGHFSSSPDQVLVIPDDEVNIDQMLRLREDMTVMSRIIDKKIQPESSRGMGHFGYGGGRGGYGGYGGGSYGGYLGGQFWSDGGTKSIYLENYGALFVAKVDFPLVSSVDCNEPNEVDDSQDKLWHETRMEIYDSEKFHQYVEMHKKHKSGPDYDSQKVEALKNELIKALKHASNIRDLNTNSQRVVITIIGDEKIENISVEQVDGHNQVNIQTKSGKRIIRNYVGSPPRPGFALGTRSVLTIWALKGWIDRFAKGEMDFENFRSKVRVLMY
ncbi:MAG: hypothetical protein ACYSWP_20070 [Planctomycetota bacterium]|jgi:hypothetical protein